MSNQNLAFLFRTQAGEFFVKEQILTPNPDVVYVECGESEFGQTFVALIPKSIYALGTDEEWSKTATEVLEEAVKRAASDLENI